MSQAGNPDPTPDSGGSLDHHEPGHHGPDDRRPGRRAVLDDFKKQQIYALLAAGCCRASAARYVGCAPSTITRTAKRDPEFAARLKQAEVGREISEIDKVRRAGERSWRAAAWLLRHYHPARFSPPRQDAYTHEQLLCVARSVGKEMAKAAAAPFSLRGETAEDRLNQVLDELRTKAGVRRRLKDD